MALYPDFKRFRLLIVFVRIILPARPSLRISLSHFRRLSTSERKGEAERKVKEVFEADIAAASSGIHARTHAYTHGERW